MIWRSVLLTPNVLGKDGVSALSREMACALPSPCLILSLHDTSCSARRSPLGIEVRGARGSRIGFLAAAASAVRRTGSETVVSCSHLHLAPIARLLALVSGCTEPPSVVLCGIEAWVPLRRFERWALATSDLVAISQHTVARFKAANPAFSARDVVVCHPGLAARAVAPERESMTALIVARMSAAERYKGHDALLDIWPRVVARHPDAVLMIAGDGDDRSRLEARARERHIDHAVRFIGRVNDDDLAAMYDRCRFFVMPSRDEGFGLVFLEAMRSGKACVGGAGAAAEIIDHGVTGFIVPPENLDSLAEAVDRLYADAALCARFGAAGRERFLSAFTDHHFQTRFAHVIARHTQAALAESLS